MQKSSLQARIGRVIIVAVAVLVIAAGIRHVRKSHATALMQEYMLVPVMPEFQVRQRIMGSQLASFPGRMQVQGLRMVQKASTQDRNIWDSDAMGTNSIFMGNMPQSAVNQVQAQRAEAAATQRKHDDIQGPPKTDKSWVGTNEAFFGANGGGYGLARGQKAGLAHASKARGTSKASAAAPSKDGKKAMMRAKMMSLYRSDDAHEAEYGREGAHILDDSVLPSAVGTGGPVIGVDGMPSNFDHAWVHHKEAFSFACNPDIVGCQNGLTVDPTYAWD